MRIKPKAFENAIRNEGAYSGGNFWRVSLITWVNFNYFIINWKYQNGIDVKAFATQKLIGEAKL